MAARWRGMTGGGWCSVGLCSGVGEEGGRGGEGCGIAVGWRWPFIGSGGGVYRQELLAVNGGNDARV
jgi:hypothetical protein